MTCTTESAEAFSDVLQMLYAGNDWKLSFELLLPPLCKTLAASELLLFEQPDGEGIVLRFRTGNSVSPTSALNARWQRTVYQSQPTGYKVGETACHPNSSELEPPYYFTINIRTERSVVGFLIVRNSPFTPTELSIIRLLQVHLPVPVLGIPSADPLDEELRASAVLLETDSRGNIKGQITPQLSQILKKHFASEWNQRMHPYDLPPFLAFARVSVALRAIGPRPMQQKTFVGPAGTLHVAELRNERNQKFFLRFSEDRKSADWLKLSGLGLTPSECAVAFWVAQGKRDGEIGSILGVATKTVSKHMERIRKKMGVENRSGVAILAEAWLREKRIDQCAPIARS